MADRIRQILPVKNHDTGADPAAPTTSDILIFAKGGILHTINSAGTVQILGASATLSAPTFTGTSTALGPLIVSGTLGVERLSGVANDIPGGVLSDSFPVYDVNGVLLGRVPIYDT